MDELELLEQQGKQEREARKAARKTPEAKAKRNRGKAQRNRGLRAERELAKRLARFGYQRVPLSGAVGGSWRGDLRRVASEPKALSVFEIKRRERGFETLEGWLEQGGGVDALILKPAYKEPLVIMKLEKLEQLLEEAGYAAEH